MISPELRNKFKFKKSLKDIQQEYILAAGKFNNYLGCVSAQEIIQISQTYGHNNCIAEVSQNLKYLNSYFDFDLKDKKITNEEQLQIKQQLYNKLLNIFPHLTIQFYIKDASQQSKTSLHFIVHIKYDDKPIYFRNKVQLEQFFKFLRLEKPFDIGAHNGYCLRTLHADKYGGDNLLQQRNFKKSFMSDLQDDIYSLSCYCPNRDNAYYIDDYVKKQFVLSFVQEIGFEKDYYIDQVNKREQDNHLSLQLTEKKCHNREHESNNCVCMLFKDSITIKCHDEECRSLVQHIFDKKFIIEKVENEQITQPLIKSISQENKDVMNAHEQIMQTRNQTGSDVQEIQQLQKGGFQALVKHPQYSGFDQQLRNLIGKDGIVKHHVNGQIIEFAQSSSLQVALQKLNRVYNKQEIQNVIQVFQQFNININVQQNFYGEQDDQVSGKNLTELFDNCVQKYLTENDQILDQSICSQIGHFVMRGQKNQCIQSIITDFQKKNFILSNKESLYYFDIEQNKWTCEDGVNIGLNNLKNTICGFLSEIQIMLEKRYDKVSINLYKKIQDIALKQTENLQYQTYLYLLRRKNHEFDTHGTLLHFKNSTYDLIQNQFVENTPQYFNTLALRFDMSQIIMEKLQDKIQYLDQIISDIIPNENIKKWFLYSIVSNLVCTSKQKPIVFMKGVGSNGKSFLIQLIRNSLGPYCYKGQSTIFQKDTIQDSTKSTGTIGDAISSRICYIEELSSNQINIEKLKELTGGGTIPTRKLHQDFQEQEIRCQFYVACNNVPNFGKNIDQAIKNRIVAVPFDTEFVDNPIEEYQKKKRDISNIVKQVEYQQAFLAMLLKSNLHPQDIPKEVLVYTQEMKDDIDQDIQTFNEYIVVTHDQHDYIIKEDFKNFAKNILGENINSNFKSPIVTKFKLWQAEKKLTNNDGKVNGKRCFMGIKFTDDYQRQ